MVFVSTCCNGFSCCEEAGVSPSAVGEGEKLVLPCVPINESLLVRKFERKGAKNPTGITLQGVLKPQLPK